MSGRIPKRQRPVQPSRATLAAYKPRPERAPVGESFDEWWDSLPQHEQRIEVILDMMAQGRWLDGVTTKALAHAWNCSPRTVGRLASEAGRSLKRYALETPEQREAVKSQILQTFEVIRAKAMANGDAGSLRVALEATRTFGFWLGLEPVRRVERQDAGTDELDQLTDEQLEAFGWRKNRPRRRQRTRLAMAADQSDGGPDGGNPTGEPPVH